jgi:hypothetical protein
MSNCPWNHRDTHSFRGGFGFEEASVEAAVGDLASASNADNGTYFFFDLFEVILNKQKLSYKAKLEEQFSER